MPLRDHFRPPVSKVRPWGDFHAMWPPEMVRQLRHILPEDYASGPRVHLGFETGIETGTTDPIFVPANEFAGEGVGKNATGQWTPPAPSISVEIELPDPDEFSVRIYDERYDRQLVATIEVVSPRNKDRPESRSDFVAKCAALVRKGVAVSIVDLVTTKHFNLYADLMELLGHDDRTLVDGPPPIYVATCRWGQRGKRTFLQAWPQTLTVGQPLPIVPLWLSEDLVVPFDLDVSYEQALEDLDIPRMLKRRAAAQTPA